jgi:hypothetical protein
MPRLLVATALLGGLVVFCHTADGQATAGNWDGTRNAPPFAASGSEPRYGRGHYSNGSNSAISPDVEARAAAPDAKGNRNPNGAGRVLSPFAPPPVPRAAGTRVRSSNGGGQVDQDRRRTMGTARTPAPLGGSPLGGSTKARSNVRPPIKPPIKPLNKPRQDGAPTRSGNPSPPHVLLPQDHRASPHYMPGDNGNVRSLQREPRAMPYDPANAQSGPRAFNPDTQPLPVGRLPQAQDDRSAREQLRAIQQERMNREAARWKSEQARLKAAGKSPPRGDRQPPPFDDSQPPPSNSGDGPLLLAPSNAR